MVEAEKPVMKPISTEQPASHPEPVPPEATRTEQAAAPPLKKDGKAKRLKKFFRLTSKGQETLKARKETSILEKIPVIKTLIRMVKKRGESAKKARDEFNALRSSILNEKELSARQPSQMRQIGEKYLKGIGVKRDKKEAEKWYQRADDTEAFASKCEHAKTHVASPSKMDQIGHEMYTIGQMYENGSLDFLYVDKEEAETRKYDAAMEWFTTAADAGNIQAMKAMSSMYMRGIGGAIDLKKSQEWSLKASKAEFDVECETAKKSENPTTMYKIANMYRTGTDVVEKDETKAKEWEQRAKFLLLCEDKKKSEDPSVLYVIAHQYVTGTAFVEKDETKAKEWEQRAEFALLCKTAKEGENPALMEEIAKKYETGTTVVTKDESKAKEWKEKAQDARSRQGEKKPHTLPPTPQTFIKGTKQSVSRQPPPPRPLPKASERSSKSSTGDGN